MSAPQRKPVVLYNPPSSAGKKPILPMSLLALAALLDDREVAIVDGNLEADPLAAVDRALRDTGAATLGVTVMPGPQLADAVPTCRRLKELHPRVTVVWGGYFPTQHFDACLGAAYVDLVVRGHGEAAFAALLDRLDRDAGPGDLAGLAWRRGDEPVSNPMPAIPHPDGLPDFPYRLVDVTRYPRRTFMGARTLPHHSSYGCPFFCNFCAVVNMVEGRWVAQSAARTAAVTTRLVRELGADAVEFYDNNFFVAEARTAEFCERVRRLGIAWWGEARIDTLLRYSARSWALLRDAGLKMAFLGAESGSDETLARMNKGGSASAAKTLEIVARMREHGIVPELSFVVGNPPDPEADAAGTLEFIRQVKGVNPAAEIILYTYTPVPLAGELYTQAKAAGFAFPPTLEAWVAPEWREFAQRRSAGLPWVADPLRRRLHDFERVLNAAYPTVTDTRLTGAWRLVLRALASWRWRLRVYRRPVELALMQRLLAYQRPETSGF